MQQLLRIPCRFSNVVLCCRNLNYDTSSSTNNTRMGLPFSFDENKALDYFNRWRGSLWLAPSDWRRKSVSITRRYLPYWSFSVKGNAYAEVYVKRGSWLWGGAEWHPLADEVSLTNLDLSNVNVYAAHTYDRQHILEIDMKGSDTLQPIDDSTCKIDTIEEWTIDQDTAFEIGWDMQMVESVQKLCVQELNRRKKDSYRVTSLRFLTDQETRQLIYFPVYIVECQYRNKQTQYLINGRTGQVAGFREFSQIKINAALLGIVYPVSLLSLISAASFVTYAILRRDVTIIIALFSTGLSFPFATFGASVVSRYARDYAHLYRGTHDIREWLDFKKRNPYLFTDKAYEKQQETTGFHRERVQEPTFTIDVGPNLYDILGVSRVADITEIKKAYLLKAKEFHPDRNVGNKEIEEKFKLINQAYAVLSDPEQRQLFDEYGYEHVKYK